MLRSHLQSLANKRTKWTVSVAWIHGSDDPGRSTPALPQHVGPCATARSMCESPNKRTLLGVFGRCMRHLVQRRKEQEGCRCRVQRWQVIRLSCFFQVQASKVMTAADHGCLVRQPPVLNIAAGIAPRDRSSRLDDLRRVAAIRLPARCAGTAPDASSDDGRRRTKREQCFSRQASARPHRLYKR